MERSISKALLLAALFSAWSAAATAYPTLNAERINPPLPSATALAEAAPALAPMAFVQFCQSYQDQCADAASAASITLDTESWRALHRVNGEVNEAIAPDASKGGYDWSLETRLGNCNDYAVQKRRALIDLGYPMAALSLAVVRTAFGEGHLVLTVRTDRGDFVLDNRRTTIVAWNRTGYDWLKRQSAENPLQWVALSNKPNSRSIQSAGHRPAIAPPSKAAPELPDNRNAVALSVSTYTISVSDLAATIPLPSIGIAAKQLDIVTALLWENTSAIGAKIAQVATERP